MANIFETNPNDQSAGSYIGKYYTRLRIGPYKRPHPFKESSFESNLIVYLPLPDQLQDTTTVKYTSTDLETVGDLMDAANEAAPTLLLRKAGTAINAGVSGLAGSLTTAATQSSSAGDFMQKQLGSIFSAEKINSAIQQSMGMAPNPNPSVSFQGPSLRTFTFNWSFYPKNAKESQDISDLINKLKSRALPTFNAGDNITVLNYPYMCKLNFFPWDDSKNSNLQNPSGWTKNSIIKIKKCFMDSVNVKYNPFGTPAFFEGTNLPISYQLTISFKEIEYMTGKDWDSSESFLDEANKAYGEYNAATFLLKGVGAIGVTAIAATLGGATKELFDLATMGYKSFTGLADVPLTQEQEARKVAGSEAITKLKPNETAGFYNPETNVYVEFAPSTETPGGYVVRQYNAPTVVKKPDGTIEITTLGNVGATSFRTDAKDAIEQANQANILANSIRIIE